MQLDANSRLVKFAYWMNRPKVLGYTATEDGGHWVAVCSNIPNKTSLCKFFWRAFVIVPIISPFVFAALSISAAFIWIGSRTPKLPKPLFLSLAVDKLENKVAALADSIKYSTFIAGLWAFKQNICPIITFEGREDGEQNS